MDSVRTKSLARVAATLTLALAALALMVVLWGAVPGDQRVLSVVDPGRGDGLRTAARVVHHGTGYLAVAAMTAMLVLVLLALRRFADGLFLAVAVAGALVGNALLKRLVERPRPELLSPLEDVSAYSFPSGHAAGTAALAAAVVLLAAGGRWMLHVAVLSTLLVLVAGAAQLVLELHHPSDVLAGWLWAGAWTTAMAAVRCGRR
jgi:hypothetical protein